MLENKIIFNMKQKEYKNKFQSDVEQKQSLHNRVFQI